MNMTEPLSRLAVAAATIAAPGTDPDHLAAVLAWAVRPRRSTDALRRRLRDQLDLVDASGGSSATSAATASSSVATVSSATSTAARLAAATRPGLQLDDVDAARVVAERWRALDCRIALVGDPGYPPRLALGWPDVDVPVWLIRRGTDVATAGSVAIVGTRRPTTYGTGVASWLAEAVARIGVRVVSGGALGIDAAAHRAALGTPGGTTVVLGCGHGVSYPRPHARRGGLFDQILDDDGDLVGELFPQQPARPVAVRARNRIVAGLADAVVVVEGGTRSGALLTADAAAGLGRPVLAVPGDVRAPGSAAPHRLLREGASPCAEPADLLAAIQRIDAPVAADSGHPRASGTSGGQTRSSTPATGGSDRSADGSGAQPLSALPAAAAAILRDAWPRAVTLEDLATRSDIAVGPLLAAVTRARLAGELAEDASGVRLRRAPATPPTGHHTRHGGHTSHSA